MSTDKPVRRLHTTNWHASIRPGVFCRSQITRQKPTGTSDVASLLLLKLFILLSESLGSSETFFRGQKNEFCVIL